MKKYNKVFESSPSEISILSYDALGVDLLHLEKK